MDFLSELAFKLDSEDLSSFDQTFWHAFASLYKERTLIEFDANVFLRELEEARVLIQHSGYIVFRFHFYFSFFIGRYYASREEKRREFFKSERYLRSGPAVVDAITGLGSENGDVIEALCETCEALAAKFAQKYAGLDFDPMLDAKWLDSSSEDEDLWEPVVRQIESGPREVTEIDSIKSSLLSEARTSDQEVRFAEFTELERKIFAVSSSLRHALRNSDGVDAPLKIRAVKAVQQSEMLVYQIGLIFSPVIARTNLFIWGGLAFIDFKKSVEDGEIDTPKGKVAIANAITASVANKSSNELGLKKLGPVFRRIAEQGNATGFSQFINYCCLLNARSDKWDTVLEGIIRSTDKNSYYMFAMLDASIRVMTNEVLPAIEREKVRRLVALIRTKRDFKKDSPGQKVVSKVLKYLKSHEE